jgi:hypothetical protein
MNKTNTIAPQFDNYTGCRATAQKATVHARQSLEWAKWARTVSHKDAITDYLRQTTSKYKMSRAEASNLVWRLKSAAKNHGDLPVVRFAEHQSGKTMWLFDSLSGYRPQGMVGSYSLYKVAGSHNADAIEASIVTATQVQA